MRLYFVFALILFLSSCGGVDNTEPPATLQEFKPAAILKLIKEVDLDQGDTLFSRVKPLELKQRLVFVDSDGMTTAVNKNTLNIIWQIHTGKKQPSVISGTETRYLIGTHDGELMLLDAASGKEIWSTTVSSEILSKPVIESGLVIVKTVDGQITVLDESSGSIKWFYKRDVPTLSVRGMSAPLVVDNKVITGLDNGKLIILDLQSGKLFWEKTISIPRGRSETERLVDIDADIILLDSVLYLAGYQGKVVALDLTNGEFLWSKKMSVINNMVLDNDRLYITDVRSHIWALDAKTGATIWKQSDFTARKLTTVALFQSQLVFSDYQGYLHVIAKADGHLIARTQVDETGVNTSPVIVGDKILVYAKTGMLYQLNLKKLVVE